MTIHQALAFIADCYIPALAIVAVRVIVSTTLFEKWAEARSTLLVLITGLAVAYVLMGVDLALDIWPAFGLDYSTHSAVSLVLVMFLSLFMSGLRFLWWVSYFGYLVLMWFLQYHTFADMLTTTVVVSGIYGVYLWFKKRTHSAADAAQ